MVLALEETLELRSNLLDQGFLWKITMHGLYTMERASKLGHEDGFYSIFPGQLETPKHIFFNYCKANRGLAGNAIYFESDPYSSYLVNIPSFIDILDSSLSKTPIGTTRIFVVYQMCWTLWLHKNNWIYQHKSLLFSPCIKSEISIEHLKVFRKYSTSYKKRRQLQRVIFLVIPHRWWLGPGSNKEGNERT